MSAEKPLPHIWLLSDQRNDHLLEAALRRLPRGSALVLRHYHLAPGERLARFRVLARIARARGHRVILAGDARLARRWGADGVYGAPGRIGPLRRDILAIATAHSLAEIGAARRMRADAVMLSPVFCTRSHPGGATLGAIGFMMLAKHAPMPVIALGGMDAHHARRLRWPRWAAIAGLCGQHPFRVC